MLLYTTYYTTCGPKDGCVSSFLAGVTCPAFGASDMKPGYYIYWDWWIFARIPSWYLTSLQV